jgi:hypothetical protein
MGPCYIFHKGIRRGATFLLTYDAPFGSLPLADLEIPWRYLVSVCVTTTPAFLQDMPFDVAYTISSPLNQ